MFLPRQTPFQANQRPSLRRNGSSTSSVSFQVHETILAAKARDLSIQCGLGLAEEEAGTLRNGDPSSRSRQSDDSNRKTSSRQGTDHLFARSRPAGPPCGDSLITTRPSIKRQSLRGYAQARWARDEILRDRILSATNVAKLEWEASAALLNHSYPLAILLLFRAASLGSASACKQLADLYADGVTRGTSPTVTLVYRDTLRSIAWILEALRLYELRLTAKVRSAATSATPSLRLAQIWHGPLQATQLLVEGLLSPDVGAFDPCQKNAVFLPIVDDLADSQWLWPTGSAPNNNHSARQATELWIELEDLLNRWSTRFETEASITSLQATFQPGPDDLEEEQSFASQMQKLDYQLRLLRAIQATRFLILEPYAENIDQVESAWIKALAIRPQQASQCLDPSRLLNVLSRAKGCSGRIYDQELFSDLQRCTQSNARSTLAIDYNSHKLRLPLRADHDLSQAKDKQPPPPAATQNRDRLRDLEPADVETTKQLENNARPALAIRVSSGYAAPQATVVSVSAHGEQQNPKTDGGSASRTVRQKYGRAVSSSFATSLNRADARPTEPSSPTDSVRTGFSIGIARPRRPSSIVSVTPSLLFPSESVQDDLAKNLSASQDSFADAPSRRVRSSSSTLYSPNGDVSRPRVASLHSSAPMLVLSKSAASLIAPSMSTTSHQNLHALASADSTPTLVPSRRRTGSNASIGSLNPRTASALPKTSPSISEAPEALISPSLTSTTASRTGADSSRNHSAAADTLRRLKGRRSHTDLRTLHSARNSQSSAPPVPSLPTGLAQQLGPEVPRVSTLRPSKSTVFVSLENLHDERPGNLDDAKNKMTRISSASADSALEHLARTQERISHRSIPSVLEERESGLSVANSAMTGPPFASALAAGALSGLTVDLLFFPIDTIKTRLQSAQGFWAAGGFSGVYRGLSSTAVGSAPGAAVFFTTYESMKPALMRWAPGIFGAEGTLGPAGVHMVAASIAEVAACLIRVPTEVIKSRQQTMTYGKGTTTFQAFKKVFREAGIRGYYRGFGSTVGREIPFTCIQFPLYERLKLEMARSRAQSQSMLRGDDAYQAVSDQELIRNLPTWQAGLAGSIAGAIAAGLTTPLDVVKTRIMLHTKHAAVTTPGASSTAAAGAATMAETLPRGVNTNIIPTLLHIGHTEGIKTLFSGFLPRTMWIGLGGAVFLGTFDAGIKTLS